MAGIKIHQYPLERFTFGDDDYYDIDYWDGAAYQTAKIKGSVIKAALAGASELNDLTDVNTGLPVSPTNADDGKLLFYDHAVNEFITDDAVTHGTVIINGKKSTAGTIAKGTPVYLVGFDSDLHTVEVADATSSATMPIIGLAAENMDDTNSKHITTFGKLTGVDTTATSALNPNGETWAVNDALYMSTTAGGFTKVRPTGGATEIQRIAKVLKVDATGGQLFVFNTARTAGLPNLGTDKLWIGDANGIPQEVDKSTIGGASIYTSNGILSGPRTVSHGGNLLNFNGRTHIGSIGSDNSAILSVGSTTRGFLLPRMTTTEKNNITTPAESLIVYDTDLNDFQFYNSAGSWVAFAQNFANADLTFTGNRTHDIGTNFMDISNGGTLLMRINGNGDQVIEGAAGNGISIGTSGSAQAKLYVRGNASKSRVFSAWNNVGYAILDVYDDRTLRIGEFGLGTGALIAGASAVVGSEKISFQNRTAVKGADTFPTSTAFEIYDGDTTPSKLWDFRNNGDLVFNKSSQNITDGTNNVLTLGELFTGSATNGSINFQGDNSDYYPFNIYAATSSSTSGLQMKIGKDSSSYPNVYGKSFLRLSAGTSSILLGASGRYMIYNDGFSNLFSVDGNGDCYINPNSGYAFCVGGTSAIGSEDISLQGNTLIDGTLDMNNNRITKTIVNPTVQETTSTATLTIDANQENTGVLTAQAVALTVANPTGAAVQGQKLVYRIKDNGTGRAITWGANFRAIGVTLPTTTTASKLLYVGCIYNNTDSKWDVVAVNEEA